MDIEPSNIEPKAQAVAYDRITPTAWLAAYQRTLSDIPLSREVFSELEGIAKHTRSAAEFERVRNLMRYSAMATKLEARFKIVDRLLNLQGSDQILEVASGMSPRGLEMTKNPDMRYVEFDLPAAMQMKRQVAESLFAKSIIPARPNLHFEDGNALTWEEILRATRFLKQSHIAIVNEGFLQYMSMGEKSRYARNVNRLLANFGGAWITPDIPTKITRQSMLLNRYLGSRVARLAQITGVDVSKNRFHDENAAQNFFEEIGFRIERHSPIEIIDQLVSPQKFNLPREKVEQITNSFVVFVMTRERS